MKYRVNGMNNKNECSCPTCEDNRKEPHKIDHESLSLFIHQEVAPTYLCGCPECHYRQVMFNALQNIIDIHFGLKSN